MQYYKLAILMILVGVLFMGCPKKQTVEPVEEVPVEEEIPFEEVEIPEEIPEEPPRPEFVVNRVFFDFDKSDIRADASEILLGNAEMLKIYPEINVTVEGHCCEIGTAEYNLALGQRRAKAVRDYMLMNGITPDRLSTVSYGEEKPLDPANLEMNRRCEFTIQ